MRQDIQGLRGVAVLLVVLYHGQLGFSGGFVGVDTFFVISGFVITGVLTRDVDEVQSMPRRLSAFYARRARRLLPALGVVIGSTLCASLLLESSLREQSRTAWSAVSSLLFSANIRYLTMDDGYFSLGSQTNPLLHIWSLSIEEQFYFMFPIAFMVLHIRLKSRKSLFTWIGLSAIVSLALCLGLAHQVLPGIGSQQLSFYLPFTRAWEFLAGSAMFLYATTKTVRFGRWSRLILISIGGAGLVWSSLFLDEKWVFPGVIALVPVISTAILLLVGISGESSLLSWQPLTWIGDRSYGWYLWHWPFIVFALHEFPRSEIAAPAAAFMSLIPATLSYRFLEQPVRNQVGWGQFKAVWVWAIFVVAPLTAAIALGATSSRLESSRQSIPASVSDGRTLKSCADEEQLCLPASSIGGTAVLVGDSHSGMIANEFQAASELAGYTPAIASFLGCPFIDTNIALYLYNFDSSNLMTTTDCSKEYSMLLAWIEQTRPKVVFLVNNSPLYTQAPGFDERFDLRVACMTGTGSQCLPSSSSEERLQYFEDRLTKTVNDFAKFAQRVVVSLPMPQMFREPDQFTSADELRGTPRSQIDAYRSSLLPHYEKLLRNPKVTVWDPVPYLCSTEVCPNGDKQGDWYSDNGHLGPRGASQLQAPLSELLRELAQS